MDIRFLDSLKEEDIKGKVILGRFDFNVPTDEHNNITDDVRIRRAIPTINYILDNYGKLVILSHRGRPKGKRLPEFSMKIVAKRLERLLKKDIVFVDDCIGEEVKRVISETPEESVVFLENLRFHAGETKNDEEFAKKLAELGDIYIDDAFGNAHRTHASNVAITKFVKTCVAGFLMKDEIMYFKRALENPTRPLVSIVGGAKVSDKLGALENLLDRVDKMIVGGGMAFTFLKALGNSIGNSLVEEELIGKALDIMRKADKKDVKFYLPVDCVVAREMSASAEIKVVPIKEIPDNWIGLDIGPATTTLFSEVIKDARTIVWNGPMGVFEIDQFARGTMSMVHSVANTYALTIIGGGDTDVAIHKAGEVDRISYISTGGGAFLHLLEGKDLPAIKALEHCC
jgi:phosphoglycerate kinase